MIKFNFNYQKAIEVILYLANKRPSIDKMSLYKYLFFADIEHLNKYGRPIVGGDYLAMQFGPVLEEVKNLIENDVLEEFKVNDYWITATRKSNEKYLSKSDMEALDCSYGRYCNCNAWELSELSHKHIAWLNARNKNPDKNNNVIDYKDFIDPCNKELIEDLEESSEYIQI